MSTTNTGNVNNRALLSNDYESRDVFSDVAVHAILEIALQMKCSGCLHYCYNLLIPYPEL